MRTSQKSRNNIKHNNNKSDNPFASHRTDGVTTTTLIIPLPLVIPTEVETQSSTAPDHFFLEKSPKKSLPEDSQ